MEVKLSRLDSGVIGVFEKKKEDSSWPQRDSRLVQPASQHFGSWHIKIASSFLGF